ncbi:PA2778 family cysteine peptidase [Yoonia sediminilitoris]|uniref:Tetratricopeptide repeat protein n=1 Tax=Yoonia sediminilitoris TaxID=1286148 RepID=A0A2T6K9T5_9RHOB|nr:PA2778 family cysteine peptidase [Yoonia sediminilitoris]PUB11567.1 tetratricopeptide repeat protein [Yoonia sediminilitoris]RCW91767.1 tetratricopeptide repeat protein [Yoonia sediminilitoris]
MPDAVLQLHPLRALIYRLFCLLALGWLAGCAVPFDRDARLSVDVPTRAFVPDVPLIEQEAFFCGPASLAMVMQWAGSDVTQDDIAALAFSPGAGGTYLADMIGSARRSGQLAMTLHNYDDLLAEIAAGHPVIVFQNLGLGFAPVWHYGVVTAYDFDRDAVFLNSGQQDQMVMPFALFDRTWARGDYWGLVVLPPDRLPASGSEIEILQAAAALERVDAFAAAAVLYQTGAARWPDSWLWYFGLGNARYAQGDLRGARQALSRARSIAPDVPEVRANLAQVRSEL